MRLKILLIKKGGVFLRVNKKKLLFNQKKQKNTQKKQRSTYAFSPEGFEQLGLVLSSEKDVYLIGNRARKENISKMLLTKPEKSESRFILQEYLKKEILFQGIVSDIKINKKDITKSQILLEHVAFKDLYTDRRNNLVLQDFRKLSNHLWITIYDIFVSYSDLSDIYVSIGDTFLATGEVQTYKGKVEHGYRATKFGVGSIKLIRSGIPYKCKNGYSIANAYAREGDWVVKIKNLLTLEDYSKYAKLFRKNKHKEIEDRFKKIDYILKPSLYPCYYERFKNNTDNSVTS